MKRLIVGFPGLTHSDEEGRLEEISRHFPNHDFTKIRYPGIIKKADAVVIPFSIEDFAQDIAIPQEYDQVGVIASSTGAAVFSHYLSQHPELTPSWYLAISPFCRLDSTAKIKVEKLRELAEDLPLGGEGIRRIILYEYLPNLLSLDTNSKLLQRQTPHVLTQLGLQDAIIDKEEAEKHHYLMGGRKEGFKTYDAAHGLNGQSIRDAVEFIKKASQ